MMRLADVGVHIFGIVVVVITVVYLGFVEGAIAEVVLSAALGFGAGIMFDRWVLCPVVDAANDARRR